MDILRSAVEAARRKNISVIVLASTTGNTALKFLNIVKGENFQIIVVTHDEGRPLNEKIFNEDTRRLLLAHNITVYTHNSGGPLPRKIMAKVLAKFGFSPWQKYLKEIKEKYGTGIKVAHIIVRMLIEGKILKDNRVVAIAGKKSGADSAGVFLVKPQNKWPILEEALTNNL